MLSWVGVVGSARADEGARVAIIATLNAERQSNGIPGDLAENADWSAKCALHTAYMKQNGVLIHPEASGSPGYSVDGNWAGTNSVLAEGLDWSQGDVFDDAPIHLAQLMSPELTQVGVDFTSGWTCITTWPGFDLGPFAGPQVFAYPGDGTRDVPFAETANELPFVPGDFVGVPQGTPTGFNIIVYGMGLNDEWNAHITQASLTGPGGPVEVRTIDRTSATIGPYLPPGGGFIIPVSPLAPGTSYTASVVFDAGEAQKTWTFTTAARPNTIRLRARKYGSGVIAVTVSSDAPSPQLSLTSGPRRLAPPLVAAGSRLYRSGSLKLRAGTWQACAESGGGDTGFTTARSCATIKLKSGRR